MKQVYKVLTMAVVMSCLSLTMFAQFATDDVTAVAIIVAPITVTKTADFDFGWLTTSAAGGTVMMAAAGGLTPTGGVGVVAGGTAHVAAFDVTGQGTNLYTITWPASVTLTRVLGGTLTLAAFTTAVATGTVGTLSGGAQTFTAGGTLTIPANSVPGTYTSADFLVRVTYN